MKSVQIKDLESKVKKLLRNKKVNPSCASLLFRNALEKDKYDKVMTGVLVEKRSWGIYEPFHSLGLACRKSNPSDLKLESFEDMKVEYQFHMYATSVHENYRRHFGHYPKPLKTTR